MRNATTNIHMTGEQLKALEGRLWKAAGHYNTQNTSFTLSYHRLYNRPLYYY
jgi:hypothetical protein